MRLEVRTGYLTALVAVVMAMAFPAAATAPPKTLPYFASVTPTDPNVTMQWTRGADGTGGTLQTIGASQDVSFSLYNWKGNPIPGLQNFDATLVLDAVAPRGDADYYVFPPNPPNEPDYTVGMSGLSGSFSLIYQGSPFTWDGVQYSTGADLLSGKFGNAEMSLTNVPTTPSGYKSLNFLFDVCAGKDCGRPERVYFTSDLLDWNHQTVKGFSFWACTQCTSGLNGFPFPSGPLTTALYQPGQALPDFSVHAAARMEGHTKTGELPLPEPDGWALMLLGVGAIGASARIRASRPASR
jgi:hypothetical protein